MEANALAYLAAGIGAAIAVVGGALGIGKIASSAMESIGRQPEAGKQIQGAMLVPAVLIEGATIIALVICIILATK